MSDETGGVLPYRTTGEEIERLVEARARGRDLVQVQALNFATGAFQGTLAAGTALGMLHPESKELLSQGRDFALADSAERRAILFRAMRAYEPYGLLLDAIFGRGHQVETSLDWILTWWSSHEYGNSQTNRDEGCSAFAKLVEYVGLGSYVPGRRGHPTRIRWNDTAAASLRGRSPIANASAPASRERSSAPDPPQAPRVQRAVASEVHDAAEAAPPLPVSDPPAGRPVPHAARPGTHGAFEGRSSLLLTLGPGRTVDLSVPAQVTAGEKQRLLSLISLFISAAGD